MSIDGYSQPRFDTPLPASAPKGPLELKDAFQNTKERLLHIRDSDEWHSEGTNKLLLFEEFLSLRRAIDEFIQQAKQSHYEEHPAFNAASFRQPSIFPPWLFEKASDVASLHPEYISHLLDSIDSVNLTPHIEEVVNDMLGVNVGGSGTLRRQLRRFVVDRLAYPSESNQTNFAIQFTLYNHSEINPESREAQMIRDCLQILANPTSERSRMEPSLLYDAAVSLLVQELSKLPSPKAPIIFSSAIAHQLLEQIREAYTLSTTHAKIYDYLTESADAQQRHRNRYPNPQRSSLRNVPTQAFISAANALIKRRLNASGETSEGRLISNDAGLGDAYHQSILVITNELLHDTAPQESTQSTTALGYGKSYAAHNRVIKLLDLERMHQLKRQQAHNN